MTADFAKLPELLRRRRKVDGLLGLHYSQILGDPCSHSMVELVFAVSDVWYAKTIYFAKDADCFEVIGNIYESPELLE